MEDQLQITASFKEHMLSARKWLKFLTVLSTIGLVLMVLAGIAMMFVPSLAGVGVPGVALGIIYFVIALIYLYPIVKCFALCGNIDRAMKQDAQADLELMAKNTNSVLKFFGIIAILVICLYVVAIIAGIAGAALGMSLLP